MKNFIKLLIVAIVLFLICELIFSPKSNVPLGLENIDTKCCSNVQCNKPSTNKSFQKHIVAVKALGNVDESDIYDVINVIEQFYGYTAYVGTPIKLTQDLFVDGSDIVNADACLNKFFSKEKVVYVLDKRLWRNGNYLRGYAATNGGTVFVRGEKSYLRETTIHELGHTLGLNHCNDLSCIMAINNDQYDSGTFCRKCANQISFYE